jgi:hypothetical protein
MCVKISVASKSGSVESGALKIKISNKNPYLLPKSLCHGTFLNIIFKSNINSDQHGAF